MLLLVSTFISALVSNFLIFDFMNMMFERKQEKNHILKFVVLVMIMALVNLRGSITLNYLWTIALYLILTLYMYESNDKNIQITTFCYLMILLVLETISAAIVSIILPTSEYFYQFSLILGVLPLLILQGIVRKYMIKNEIFNFNIINIIDVVVIVFSFFIVYLMYFVLLSLENNKMKFFVIAISFIILFFDLYIVYIIREKEKSGRLKLQLETMKTQREKDVELYHLLQKNFNSNRALLHDFKNHTLVLESLYEKGNLKEAVKYKEELLSRVSTNRRFSNDHILQILINDAYEQCNEKKITLNIIVDPRVELSSYSEVDIVVIVSNILNNAIEASVSVNELYRFVKVEIKLKNLYLSIKVTNSYKNVKLLNGTYLSTKSNHFGIGLDNIKNAVNNLDGLLNIKHDAKEFVIEVLLPYLLDVE